VTVALPDLIASVTVSYISNIALGSNALTRRGEVRRSEGVKE
jgi:hypothetical protein